MHEKQLEKDDKELDEEKKLKDNAFMNWITTTMKSAEHPRTTYGNTGQLLHEQCIPQSQPPEIEQATTDCSAETLQLSHQFISYTSDAKSTSHGNCEIHNINYSTEKKCT